MQPMTEDLIRNVVQQVLSQMGGNGTPSPSGGQKTGGQDGVYPTADAAVAAAERAFAAFRLRPLGERDKAVREIKRLCVERAEEWGRKELDETKIGRLDHKISKLRDAIPPIPGVEYLRTENNAGDNGLTLTQHAPFGVIGAITPVTHSLPTLASNAINMLAAGNTVVFNAHPSGANIAAEGVRAFNRAIREAIGLDDLLTIIDPPTIESADALFKHRGVKRRGQGGPGEQQAGDRRRAGQPPGRGRRHRLPRQCRQVDRRRRGLRQQPPLHRREAGLRHFRHLR
jgi:aldehyde dehydrogenase